MVRPKRGQAKPWDAGGRVKRFRRFRRPKPTSMARFDRKNIAEVAMSSALTPPNQSLMSVLPQRRPQSSRSDKPGEKKKPQVRGCRTLVQLGTGRQDSPGRGDGLGWTTSTPPDSSGVPRDVPDVSRSHREVPTNQKVRFDKKIKSASNVRFPGPPVESQRNIEDRNQRKISATI